VVVGQSVVKIEGGKLLVLRRAITLVLVKEREMTGEGQDRRRCERVPLARSGNYVLESGRYYPCEIENVSATGMLVRGVARGHFGEWVVAHVDKLGCVEGVIVRSTDGGFAIERARSRSERQSGT
jgi:hypothetical protein